MQSIQRDNTKLVCSNQRSCIGLNEVEELRLALRQAIIVYEAIPTKRNQYGQKYVVDFTMTRLDKQAVVRSAWIVRNTEDFPRLVTCYVL